MAGQGRIRAGSAVARRRAERAVGREGHDHRAPLVGDRDRDDRPDGTAINFTLFCMGERGQFTEVGSWRPLALLMAFVTGAMVALGAGLGVLAHLSRHHRPGAAQPEDDPEGAPVDAPEDAPVDAPPDPVR